MLKFLGRLCGIQWADYIIFIREWVLPFAPPLVVGVVGYLQAEPWMWILVAMSIVFAAVMAGVMMLSFYLERRSPLNKLQTVVAFSCDLTPAATQPTLPFSANRAQRRAQKATGEVIKLSPTQINPSVSRTFR